MPILVRTSNKQSSVHGLGVFAQEDIPKGTVWWVGDSSRESIPCQNSPNAPNDFYTEKNVNKLLQGRTEEEVAQILEHTMYYEGEGGLLIHLRDGSAVINHSENFNSQMISNPENDFQKLYCVTTRDIKAREELTEDYGNYVKMTHNWAQDVFRKYVPSRLDFEKNHEIKKTTVY